MQIRKTLHQLLEIHLQKLRFKHFQQPQGCLEPPCPTVEEKTVPENPTEITTHLTPEGYGPGK